MQIYRFRRPVKWCAYYPLWGTVHTQNGQIRLEVDGLLLTTTLLTPIVQGIWGNGEKELGNSY